MTLSRFLPLMLALAVPATAQPLVVTTNPVLQDLVRQIGGADVRVECLLPDGANPAEYEPTPANVRQLAGAGLLVANGAGYEPWLDDLVRKAGYAGLQTNVSDGVALLDIDGRLHDPTDETASNLDQFILEPHAWLDPRNVMHYVAGIRDNLAELIPTRLHDFANRTTAYLGELRAVHAYAQAQLGAVPREHRRLATSLPAFRYLALAYDLTYVPIPGLGSGQELTPTIEARLAERVAQLKVPAVFFESTSHPRALRHITDATGVKTITTLYADGLGPAGSPAATYLGMFRANIDTVARALK